MKLCGLFGVMFVAVAAGPTLAERSSPSAWDGALWSVQAVVPAAGAERVLQLSATMQIAGLLTVMRAEGADYGKTLQEEMFPGKGGSSWDAAVSGIYDEAAMKLLFEKALIAELGAVDPKTLEVIEAFFGSDRGQRILKLEVEARRALLDQETEDAAKVQVILVTVDPKRDQPKLLAEYVRAFNPTFAALYGSDEQTATVAKEFKIIYQKAQIKDENTYLVDHSTQMYAFDPQGRIRLLIRHEAGAELIAADLTTPVKSQ